MGAKEPALEALAPIVIPIAAPAAMVVLAPKVQTPVAAVKAPASQEVDPAAGASEVSPSTHILHVEPARVRSEGAETVKNPPAASPLSVMKYKVKALALLKSGSLKVD